MRKLSALLINVCALLSIVGCSAPSNPMDESGITDTSVAKPKEDLTGATKLSFKSALSYDYLKSIDGEKVTINGYMATSSPVDGSFIFLMNLPYQSCPFCKPNTSILSNTMEVYPKSGTKFEYTTSAIRIIGNLVVAPSENEQFTDRYGYEFNFKIDNATYSVIDESELSPELSAWQEVASSNLIGEIYDMLEFCNFLALWPTYYVKSYENIDGETVPGFYLYPADAENFLTKPNAQYAYGMQEGYFENIRKKARKISDTYLSDLITIIDKAEALSITCLNALRNGEYTYEYKYVEMFGTEDYVYTLNEQASFESQINAIYDEFALWFSKWEM